MRQNRSIPFIVTGAILFASIGISVYFYLTNPSSDRHVQKFIRSIDKKEVSCPEPPSETITKDVHVKLEATVSR